MKTMSFPQKTTMKVLHLRAIRTALTFFAVAAACVGISSTRAQVKAEASPTQKLPPVLPVAEFARSSKFYNMALSPDGSSLAYRLTENGGNGFGFMTVPDMKPTGGFLWERRGDRGGSNIGYFQWIGANRIIMLTTLGWATLDRSTNTFKFITGAGHWKEAQNNKVGTAEDETFTPDDIVVDDRQDFTSLHMTSHHDLAATEYRPDVYNVDTDTGRFEILEKNTGNVTAWAADWEGNIRFGLIHDGVRTKLIYRKAPGGAWSSPIDFGEVGAACGIAGMDADNQHLFVFKPSPNGRTALYRFDLVTGAFSEPIFQHDKYDVVSALFDRKQRRLLGVRYDAEIPRSYWFDPTLAQLQKDFDAANPGVINEFVSWDRDMRRLLMFSHSAKEPGFYTFIDLDAGKPQLVAKVCPWLSSDDMADVVPVKCKARDGVEINGYLALPRGRGQKNLPMVTLVHGGPFGIRDVWQFDPMVQFLANRGYAVLQVNYRGSGGYGTEFFHLGRHQIGGGIQDDITDFTQWAVKKGIADSHRLAIMGGSYGGYSTLFALAHTPEMYRCGIAFAGVSDWPGLYAWIKREQQFTHEALRYWELMLGDMKDLREREKLSTVSPVNLAAQIKAPVLLIHGKADATVPVEQSYDMVSALKKAGRSPETLYFDYIGHWWPKDQEGEQFLAKIEAFLAANMGGDAAPH